MVDNAIDNEGGLGVSDHLCDGLAEPEREVHRGEGAVYEGVVHRVEGFGEVKEEGVMGGGKGVDEVVDEDVGVDPPAWDITGLEGGG